MPREAGTPAAAQARELIAAHLIALGYDVRAQRFSFHPRSLDAFPLFGVGIGGLALAVLPAAVLAGVAGWVAPVMWMAGLAALLAVTVAIGAGWATPGAAREDANLIATRAGAVVRRWIVAHADTKAQGHSMAGRLAALWVVILAVAAMTVLVVVRIAGPVAPAAAAGTAIVAVIAGALAARGRLRGTSPGARDNASGLLAALVAAESGAEGLGVLITGAEEFGLVGARIFARLDAATLPGAEVVNLDTLDDVGRLYVVAHDPAGERLAATIAEAVSTAELPAQRRRLPAGILVDSLPLARGGAVAVTVGRLAWATLRRIHTPSDTAGGMSWDTAERVGRAVARLN